MKGTCDQGKDPKDPKGVVEMRTCYWRLPYVRTSLKALGLLWMFLLKDLKRSIESRATEVNAVFNIYIYI